MRVVVTGSDGYIGTILAPILAEHGHEVSGLDSRLYRGCSFGEELLEIPTVDLDIRDVGPSDLEGFEAVVHLAALSNDPLGDIEPRLTAEINASATVALARAAREAGVRRFVFASSCSMYGASGTDEALDERSPFRPLTPYAESKVRSEEGLFELSEPDFAVTSMRNATVYGLSPRLRLDIVLNNLAGWGHTTGRIRLLSDGMAWRPLVHVRDLAKTAATIIEAPAESVGGEAFNVGSDAQNYLIRELAQMLSELTGCALEMADGSEPDQRSYRVDFSKLASDLSRPGVRLECRAWSR